MSRSHSYNTFEKLLVFTTFRNFLFLLGSELNTAIGPICSSENQEHVISLSENAIFFFILVHSSISQAPVLCWRWFWCKHNVLRAQLLQGSKGRGGACPWEHPVPVLSLEDTFAHGPGFVIWCWGLGGKWISSTSKKDSIKLGEGDSR